MTENLVGRVSWNQVMIYAYIDKPYNRVQSLLFRHTIQSVSYCWILSRVCFCWLITMNFVCRVNFCMCEDFSVPFSVLSWQLLIAWDTVTYANILHKRYDSSNFVCFLLSIHTSKNLPIHILFICPHIYLYTGEL